MMFVSIVFSCLVLPGFVTARIDVTVNQTRYNTQAGDNVTLQCSISSSEGLDTVYWKKLGRILYRNGRGNKRFSGSSTADPSLTIYDTTNSDSGYYYCHGRKGNEDRFSKWIDLRVTEVTVRQTHYTVPIGKSVTLECTISTSFELTNVYWTKGGTQVYRYYNHYPQTNSKYSVSSLWNPSLTIRNTVVADTGNYTCRGLKSKGEYINSPLNLTSSPISLRVYKPFTVSILPDGSDITIQEGYRPNSRNCTSHDCLEDCEIEWRLPNGEQKKSSIFTKPITKEEAGNYTCTISSRLLSKSKSFYVTVNYGPKSISLSPSKNRTVQEGHMIPNVTCQADCSPSCSFVWTGPNTGKQHGEYLYIGYADKTDRGIYRCTAYNDFGNISTSLRIDVNYGPRTIALEPATLSYRVLEGSMLNDITCAADCNPVCHFTWTRENISVSNDNTLSLGRLDSSKDGTYQCTARGANKSKQKTITVSTLYGPKAVSLSPPGDVSVREGQQISVGCQADCSPPCSINWTGPDTGLAGRLRLNLNINKAGRGDNGVYVCTASNDFGNKSISLRINVDYDGSDIRFIPDDTRYSYEEGTAIPDIQCIAECNPTCVMSWYHDRTGNIIMGGNLSLNSMERSKDGKYTCEANNSQGIQTLNLTVVSLFSPEVLGKDPLVSSYTVHMWGAVRDSITINASPFPLVYLLHKEDDQQEEKNIPMQWERHGFYRTVYTYVISNITYSDVGRYTLTVLNSQGAFRHNFSINIIDNGSKLEGVGSLTTLWIILLLVIIVLSVIAVVVVLKRKRDPSPGFPQQPADEDEGSITIHVADTQPRSLNDVYAEVVRPNRINGPNNDYPVVSDPSSRAEENQGEGQRSSRSTNKDGLIYLEVSFTTNTDNDRTSQIIIHGVENKCDYGEIDFSRKVSLPED